MNQCNYSNIELQKLIVTWTGFGKAGLVKKKSDFASEGKHSFLNIETECFKPKPYYYDSPNESICVFGSPIINEKIDPKATAGAYLSQKPNKAFLSSLNGEFLIIHFDKHKNTLSVINDRFASIPFYYYCQKGMLIGSFAYNDLWTYLHKIGKLRIYEEAFFEMLWLRRLLGTKTLDKDSLFLPAAHYLTYDRKSPRLDAYWYPDYTKDYSRSVKGNSIKLAEAIKQSIIRKTTDQKKYGLFLSGGMDARTILAAFDPPPVCFTATYNTEGNREYAVAHELAQVKGAKFIHLQIPQDHFSNILDFAVKQSGGMYEANSIFIGFKDVVANEVDVAFHGHGLDYMFQGKYIPAKSYKIFSRTLAAKSLFPLGNDLVSQFLYSVSYRLKFPHLLEFVRKGCRNHLLERLEEEAGKLLLQARKLSDNPYDHWEYLTFHALSRHYSYPDYASIHTNVEQRTISFDNDIYKLYQSLPVEYRFDAKVQRGALQYLNPKLKKIKNANSNLPMASSYLKTLCQLNDLFLKGVGIRKRRGPVPKQLVRTWPTHEWTIRNEKRINNIARNLGRSTALARLSWLDMDKIGQQVLTWLEKPYVPGSLIDQYTGDFIWGLIALDQFLKQTD